MRPAPRVAIGLIAAVCATGLVAACGSSQAQRQTDNPASTLSAATVTQTTTTSVTTTVPTAELPGCQMPPVMLGDMNTPEQFVLGELYAVALDAEGYRVTLTRNIGPSAVAQDAIEQGSLDLYPDYLDSFNEQVADDYTRFGSALDAYRAATRHAAHRHLVLLQMTPFSDTGALAVTTASPQMDNLQTITSLSGQDGVILGAPLEYVTMRRGLRALEQTYGLRPKDVLVTGIGNQYDLLTEGALQVAYVQSTDPELDLPAFRALADPLHVFGFGNVVPVTTRKVLRTEGPTFAATINRVDALLTTRAMRGLNSEVELGRNDPATVANQFLVGNGVIPAQPVSCAT